jgi:hypothetical protein
VQVWLESPTARQPAPQIALLLGSQLRGFGKLFASVPGTGDSDVEHATRMMWVVGGESLVLTRLGRALLEALKRETEDQLSSDVIVLDRQNPLAYAT